MPYLTDTQLEAVLKALPKAIAQQEREVQEANKQTLIARAWHTLEPQWVHERAQREKTERAARAELAALRQLENELRGA